MFKDAITLWKKIRLRGEKGTPLYLRLFLLFSFFILSLVLAFLLLLNTAGFFHAGTHKSEVWFQNELEHLFQDVSVDYGTLSVQGVDLATRLAKKMENYLKEENIAPSALKEHPEILEELFSQAIPELLSSQQVSKCSGAFLILDASIIDNSTQRAGVFLKCTEPNTVSTIDSRLHYLRGPANVAREYGIELLGQWQMEFTIEETDFFTTTVENARSNDKLPLSRLYYWSPRQMLAGNSESAMLLTIPLISSNGTVMGVCGYEVSAMLFKRSYSPDNSVYTRVFSSLSPCMEDHLLLHDGMIAGNSYLNSSMGDDNVRIDCTGSQLCQYLIDNQDGYSGLHQTIVLYPADSPYAAESWVAAVMAPCLDLEAMFREETISLQIGIACLCLLSLLAAAFISRKYISPVLNTLENIKSGGNYADLPKTEYQEINDLLEFLASQDEAASAALAEAEAKVLAAENTGEELPPAIDSDKYSRFLECLETLSPAERRVFDLYVQEYRAKDIASTLCLSMNTVKYHNSNIYGKLEVGSRKELLSYIRYMRYEQKQKEK